MLTAFPFPDREDSVCNKVKPNNEELQDATCLERNLESKQVEPIGKPKEERPNEYEKEPEAGNVVEGSPVAVPRKEEQMDPDIPRRSTGHGLKTATERQQLFKRGLHVIFLKTYNYRTAGVDMKQLDVDGQYTWFEGLPTRIHLPGPRVLCRPSKLRWTNRRCTRFCSASLDMPMYRSYKVGMTSPRSHG